ncbi:MAG TPA: chemotaxis protein CheB [Roseiarcus sp.]|nr:chemotaxis protein CheB [Roseiarcus sp.]
MQESGDRVICIGGSLGAIAAVMEFCGTLSRDIPAAICVAIHTGARGPNLLAEIFGKKCPLPFAIAADEQKLEVGRAYVAPRDRHLIVRDGALRLGIGPRENLSRPAVDPLFRSVGVSHGSRAVGVVLTGLLDDGAAGLADLKRCGGVTVVQNPGDAEAPDMPLAALRASDVDYRAPLHELGSLLDKLVRMPFGPSPPAPADVRFEVEIALGRSIGADDVAQLGDPAPLSCPDCGGVLSQVRRSPPLRFRCQVGHAYTAEWLESKQETSVDEALRVALRIAEERAMLARKMAAEARQEGRNAAALLFEKTAKESRAHVETVRNAIGGRCKT